MHEVSSQYKLQLLHDFRKLVRKMLVFFYVKRVHAHNQWPCRKSPSRRAKSFCLCRAWLKRSNIIQILPTRRLGLLDKIPIYKLGTYNILCSSFSAIYRFYVEQNITYNPWKAQATKAFLAISWVVGYMIPR